jgi:hypothetical protein
VVRAACGETPAGMIAAIFGALDAFSTTAFDDQTVLAMRVA